MVCFFSFETLRKSLQTTSASGVSLRQFYLPQSGTLRTSSVSSTTSKQGFEQPAASFLVTARNSFPSLLFDFH
ncbi:Uncharacterised protein [Streptococcus pneumoniae]|nr:Uncharacterised protein [Streptococcus pneumoniae]